MIEMLSIDDIPIYIKLGKDLHDEGQFKDKHWSEEKCQVLCELIIKNPHILFGRVYKQEDKIIGLMFGGMNEYFFGFDKFAQDLFIYVKPEYRGSSAAFKLTKAFEIWAKDIGAKEVVIGQSTGIDIDNTKHFFERLGYTNTGNTMKKGI